jgi:hypothetical protein
VAAVTLTRADLAPFATISDAKADAMIADVLALAARVAPCITDEYFTYGAAAKAVLRSAVLRWNDFGTGALSTEQVSVDDYSHSQTVDSRISSRRDLLSPSEIKQLQDLCKGNQTSGAFSVDTVGVAVPTHSDICALYFGAEYCSCGAVLTMALPLYERT